MKKADNFNPGSWLVENKITIQSKLTEIKVANPLPGANVRQILANIDEDLDEILAEEEPMIESGSSLFMDIVAEITGKDPYADDVEYTKEENEAVDTFFKEIEALGVEIV
jgi:hypothetical protein